MRHQYALATLQVTTPARTDIAYVPSEPLLVTVPDVGKHLGLLGGDGTGNLDDSTNTVLEDLVMWATERCSAYRGETLSLSVITDYYPHLFAGGLYRTSSEADLAVDDSGDPKLAVEYVPDGDMNYAALDADRWVLDATTSPPVVRAGASVPTASAEHFNPLRVVYTVTPYSRRGKALITGTILDLVGLRWVRRGQPPSYASDSAVERILGANLR